MESKKIAALAFAAFFFALVLSFAPPSFAQTTPPPAQARGKASPPQSAQAPSPAQEAQTQTVIPTKGFIKAGLQTREGKIITASGNVEIRYNEIVLYADTVVFNEETKDVLAVGHVSVIRPQEAFSADRLNFNMESGLGEGTNVVGLVQPQYRYESTSVKRETPDLFVLGKSKITGCSQPVPRWEFSASRAKFMRDEYIEMWNPVFRVKNIPIFYLPYMKYPLNQERATGFLMPQIGYSGRKGLSYTQTFYLAIARNMDATLSADYYSAKGVGGGLEFRYLFGQGTGGQLNAYYFAYNSLPENANFDNALLLRWQHNQRLPGNIGFVANVDYQNSFSFMREFDNNYARALVYNRSSQVYLTKSWTGANFSLRFSRFETAFPTANISIIRQSLPQISFSTFQKKLWGPIYYSLTSTYNNWQYGTGDQYDSGTERKSSELYVSPALSVPINTVPWLNLNLTASGHLSYYGNSLDPATGLTVEKDLLSGNYNLSASLTGPIIYKIYNPTGPGWRIKHLIEPNITYKYDSPTIDSDRIVTQAGFFFRYHFVSYGLTNHVLIKQGNDVKARAREIFTWGISQSYYLDAKDSPLSWYRLDDGSIPQFSDISTYVRFFPLADASLDFSASYNPYKTMLSSVRASASVGNPADNLFASFSWYKSFNPYYLGNLYNREQIGVTAGTKIPGLGLEALGEFEYNVTEKKVLYSGLAAVWHYQCVDFKLDARAYFFREKPEVQFRFSVGLGNISSSSDFLGGSQIGAGSSGGGRVKQRGGY